MAKDPQTDPPEDPEKVPVDPEDPEDQPDPEEDPKDQPDPEKDPKAKPQDPELKRAIARRDRALKEKAALADQLQALKDKYEPEKADPVKVANRRLVTAEARVVMTGAGITDPADQKTLSGFLGLDDVEVSGDGEVDSAAIQERLEDLAGIFAKLAKGQGPGGKRVPRTDTRDRGGEKAAPLDAARARRQAMLRGR